MADSRNLEAVSKNPFERRRFPRLVLSSAQFRSADNGKIFSVLDLSPEGIALRVLDPADLILFTAGREVFGTVNLEGERHEVRFQIHHVRKDRVGGRFEKSSPEFELALRRFSSPEMQARELRPMPSAGDLLWFHSGRGCDLWVRLIESEPESICFLHHSRYVAWTEEQGLSTGQATASEELSELRGVVALETLEMRPDSLVNREELDIAKSVILGSNLPEHLKKSLRAALDAQKKPVAGGKPGRA